MDGFDKIHFCESLERFSESDMQREAQRLWKPWSMRRLQKKFLENAFYEKVTHEFQNSLNENKNVLKTF